VEISSDHVEVIKRGGEMVWHRFDEGKGGVGRLGTTQCWPRAAALLEVGDGRWWARPELGRKAAASRMLDGLAWEKNSSCWTGSGKAFGLK
jgi:hypothetical protein